MLEYKTDIIKKLEDAGYTQYRIRKERLLGSSAMDKIRDGEMVGISSLEKICDLLDCQPGDLIKNK